MAEHFGFLPTRSGAKDSGFFTKQASNRFPIAVG
jgi:hypothetical protein